MDRAKSINAQQKEKKRKTYLNPQQFKPTNMSLDQ
jgi:hypothetical protein